MKSRKGSSSVMVENLVILPDAEKDSDSAYAWYEEQRSGLGQRFLAAVESCLTAIRTSPNAFSPVLEKYRRAVVRRFPFVIFYEYSEESDTVTVFSIFHSS